MVIQEMPDEVLVYDLETNKAHCLNQTSAFVWKACDGKKSVVEISKLLGNSVSEDLVWLAIDQLSEKNLLESKLSLSSRGQSRREAIKKIGLASVIALPFVASLAAPTSVLAVVSCGQACGGTLNVRCPAIVNCQCTGVPGGATGTCSGA
ncbi:MAG: PqqD family protein [Acidobacteria bacterium]|nr:PqqD family protein [Acidobacteriota bacterium]